MQRKRKSINPYRKKVITYQKFYANQRKYPGYYPGIKYKEYVTELVNTGALSAKTGKKMLTPKKRSLEVNVTIDEYTPHQVGIKSRTEKGVKELKRTYNKIVKSQEQRNKALKRSGFDTVKIPALTGKEGSKDWRYSIVEAVRAYTSVKAEVKRAQIAYDKKRIKIAETTGVVIESKSEMKKFGEFMNRFKNTISEYMYDSEFVAERYYNDYDAGKRNFNDLYKDYIERLYERGVISESDRDEMQNRIRAEDKMDKYRKKFAHYKRKSVRQND